MAKFVKQKVEKNVLDKVKMEQRLVKLAEAVMETRIKVKQGVPTKKIDVNRSANPPTNTSDDKVANRNDYSNHTSSDLLDNHRCNHHHQESGIWRYRTRRHHCTTTPPTQKESDFQSSLTVLVPVNKRYQKAIDYRSYDLIHNLQRFEDDLSSEKQKMRKKVAVRLKNQQFNEQDSIYCIKFLAEFKTACDS